MRIFKRVSQSVTLGVESLLDSLENQEAVARATIREVEHGAGRVRVRRQALDRELARLEQQKGALERDAETWHGRAARLRGEQDEQALECLRRRRQALAAAQALGVRLEEQRALLARIRDDEQAIGDKLGELRQREAELVSREARVSAQAAAGGLVDVDGVFDRWEARVAGHAGAERPDGLPDAFARGLAEEEERASLRAELEALSGRLPGREVES